MEIIDKILSYRETHPVAKLIKNLSNDYEKAKNNFFNFVRTNPIIYNLERMTESEKLRNLMFKVAPKPSFLKNKYIYEYDWILKQPDYKLYNYEIYKPDIYNYRNTNYPLDYKKLII